METAHENVVIISFPRSNRHSIVNPIILQNEFWDSIPSSAIISVQSVKVALCFLWKSITVCIVIVLSSRQYLNDNIKNLSCQTRRTVLRSSLFQIYSISPLPFFLRKLCDLIVIRPDKLMIFQNKQVVTNGSQTLIMRNQQNHPVPSHCLKLFL